MTQTIFDFLLDNSIFIAIIRIILILIKEKRMTKYAQQILDLVLCSTEHPTAEQIFLQMKQENSKIAQATVYNNLNALVADGKLIRLSQPGAPDRYDNTTRHDHLICTRCGALADFKFTDLTHNIEAALGARIQSYDLRIHYLCPACRKAQEQHENFER
jgi:Fe2+ or Zn2+ uptake regulation protein